MMDERRLREVPDCAHRKATRAWRVPDAGGPSEQEMQIYLCNWSDSPEAVEKLVNTPKWLQVSALAGHPLSGADCDGCAAFKPRSS